jgi:Holliday junction resolvase RusA-like endonuclease
MIYTLVIEGPVPTKKNNLRRSKNGGMFIDRRSADAIAPLLMQAKAKWAGKATLDRVSSIRAAFYVKTRRQDLDGMYTTLQDVLVKAGVLRNDNLTVITDVQMAAYVTAKHDTERVIVILDE